MSMYELFKTEKKLSGYSTFGIGGPAKYFLEVREVALMQEVIRFAEQEKLPYFVLGKGSNCLFSDEGFDGLVILNKIDFYKDDLQGAVYVGAGFSFSLLGMQTAKKGFSGLEFAAGIPGSVGGAVFMNAGAQGGETAATLEAVEFINEKGVLHHLKKEDLYFAYRTSSFQNMRGVITGAYFKLYAEQKARERQLDLLNYRIETQPYSDKSCGCVFRNPQGIASAGMLIDQTGLKGLAIGGAQVSPVHANFIVNKGGATTSDVLQLIDTVKKRVQETHGIELEAEIRVIPHNVLI